MTQNNNSLLPEGYRFWSDDNATFENAVPEPRVAPPKNEEDESGGSQSSIVTEPGDGLTALNLSESGAATMFESGADVQPISVEFLQSSANFSSREALPDLVDELVVLPSNECVNESSNHQPISVDDLDLANSPALPTSGGLSDFWLQALQTPNGSVIDSEWVEHKDTNPGWPEQEHRSNLCEPQFSFWRCDTAGRVAWFLDQNGIGWLRDAHHENLFCSADGGERSAIVLLTSDGCCVEDSDGTSMTITFAGGFKHEKVRESREEHVRNLLNVFYRVDTNGDERLSLAEIESSLHSCEETERPLINSLRTHFKRIEWSRRGMFGHAAAGLTLKEILDLTANGNRNSSNDIDELLLSQIETVIDFLDPNRTGFIAPEAFELALQKLVMPAQLRQALEGLIRRLNELSLFRAYGFNAEQWKPSRHAARLMLCDVYNRAPMSASADMPTWASRELRSDYDETLYADEKNPLASISIGAINNCVDAHQSFMSVVAAVIVHDPEEVLRTVRRSDNGAFVVTFSGDRNVPVRVLLPAQKEIHEYGLAAKHGVWAKILGRAFGHYLEHTMNSKMENHSLSVTHQIAQLFVGKEVRYSSLKEQCSNELANQIDSLWMHERMMVLCRFPRDEQDTSASVLKHTCAVVGWEPQSGEVSFLDPQGGMVQRISFESLQTTFDTLLYST
ncbi:MAG: hypothetical protein SGJ27_06820 [Candidatus Melainabacteria bacterium]|nr:hypothetical protein [Candidatus Melainabacteria bacterium]